MKAKVGLIQHLAAQAKVFRRIVQDCTIFYHLFIQRVLSVSHPEKIVLDSDVETRVNNMHGPSPCRLYCNNFFLWFYHDDTKNARFKLKLQFLLFL
jgi:hypothetical protein